MKIRKRAWTEQTHLKTISTQRRLLYSFLSLYWLYSTSLLEKPIHQSKSCIFFMGTSISSSVSVVSETISHCDLPFLNVYSAWNCTNQSTTRFHVALYCSLVSCIDFKLHLECLLLNWKCLLLSDTQQVLKKFPVIPENKITWRIKKRLQSTEIFVNRITINLLYYNNMLESKSNPEYQTYVRP